MSTRKAPPDLQTVGGRIEYSLKPARKTVKGLANALDVPVDTVKKWINNEQYPSQDMLDRMAVVLGFPFGDQWLALGIHTHL